MLDDGPTAPAAARRPRPARLVLHEDGAGGHMLEAVGIRSSSSDGRATRASAPAGCAPATGASATRDEVRALRRLVGL